jgi:hypothetical protein
MGYFSSRSWRRVSLHPEFITAHARLVAVYHRDLARALEGVESSSDSGAGNILGLLIGSLSRANRFLVKR